MKPVALVTGASRGIGRAIAARLASDHHVVAVARSTQQLDELAAGIAGKGGSCDALTLDVTDWSAVGGALTGRHVDVLVLNAGSGPVKPLLEMQPVEWHNIVDVNLNSLYHVTRAILPGMIERRRGHIVVIGSIAGRSTFPGGTAYAGTKHAVMAFTECLMLEVREHRVKVSVVMPGATATSFSGRGGDAGWKLQPENVADAVASVLATPEDVLIHRMEVRTLNPPPKR